MSGRPTTLRTPDSGAVRQARYRATARGQAADLRHNRNRIFVGRTYIGTENRYPAPRDAVAQFARGLIERHRKELPWHA